ncbi:M3 family metallopeptidase [Wandonia haliotis]|uniref:M3 family metallopeptidase n=1 Tax=Wandonia haliotis TaxID=574963 RepID=A0ABP3XX13_9FLAO
MKRILSVSVIAVGLLSACGTEENDHKTTPKEKMNPFFVEKYDTPFEVPPFDLISEAHYLPAFREGIKRQKDEIQTIINNEEAPTFENTLLALENSGELLSRVSSVFYNISSANTNDEIQAIAEEISPELSAHRDDIALNEKLFARIQTLWENKATLNLNSQQTKVLENQYKSFVRGGANLPEDKKGRLREINEKISLLTLKFGQNQLAETNDFQLVIDQKSDLSGLSDDLIETAAREAGAAGMEGKWLFTLHNPSVMPFLQYADNRNLRKQIWEAYQMRGNNNNENDNKEVLRELVELRAEKALLLGYENHAAYKLEESMAGTPDEVYALLNRLWEPALEKAKKEAKDLQAKISEGGESFKLEPYDWRYYTEKIRKERYEINEEEIREYFSLDNVRDGIFDLCDRLYGLQFVKLDNVPVYHSEVVAYEVKEKNGQHVGVLYMDFHPRTSKRGGAWMTSYRSQSVENGQRKAPVISIVCNFTKPTANKPSLLTFDEVETFFHEFGHALHGLLSDVQYKSLAGTNVYTDFVELPSQVMENWAGDPEFMKEYAKHYKTGEVIPDALIEKLQRSGTFDQGFATTEYLAASLLDMHYHTTNGKLEGDINTIEREAMNKIGLIGEIIPRYRSTYFSHIFAGGYSAGYYSYIWSGVLDTDAYQAFKETSLFDQATAKAFRENILEKGGSEDPMELYVKFRGAKPGIEPLLKKRGLN